MAKRLVEGIAVETGSGNVFADLGLPDVEKLKIKSGLAIEITRAVRKLGLTQEEAGRRMGIPQPKVSALLRGDFANLSEHKLMDSLNRLGYDIEIKVKPAAEPVGHRTLAIAWSARGTPATPEPPAAPAAAPYPWETPGVRDDVAKVFNLRLPEPYLLRLKHIAEGTPDSMQRFCLGVLLPAIDVKIVELTGK